MQKIDRTAQVNQETFTDTRRIASYYNVASAKEALQFSMERSKITSICFGGKQQKNDFKNAEW